MTFDLHIGTDYSGRETPNLCLPTPGARVVSELKRLRPFSDKLRYNRDLYNAKK